MIGNRTMIEWTYIHSKKSRFIDDLIVATDDARIFDTVNGFGGKAIMTSPDHATGTDRLIEVANLHLGFELVLNIQGDEPGIESDLLDGVIQSKKNHPTWQMATACVPFLEIEDPKDPNRVKVVFDSNLEARYFSRSCIPYSTSLKPIYYRHLGIYLYDRDFLLKYNQLPKSDWEAAESLEQLRALQSGYKIGMFIAKQASLAVDTPGDLEIVRNFFQTQGLI